MLIHAVYFHALSRSVHASRKEIVRDRDGEDKRRSRRHVHTHYNMKHRASRGQVSVEFAMIFVALLMLFVVIAALVPEILRGAAKPEQAAQAFLAQLKLHAITASTSTQDYQAILTVPLHLGGSPAILSVYADQDNFAVLEAGGTVMGRTDLPFLASATDDPAIFDVVHIQNFGNGVEVIY